MPPKRPATAARPLPHRTATGLAECGAAMAAWRHGNASPAVFGVLAKCRAAARVRRVVESVRAKGEHSGENPDTLPPGRAYFLGHARGFDDGRAFAAGPKHDRSRVRRQLGKARKAETDRDRRGYWAGYVSGLDDLASQRAEAIRAGRAPRTVSPRKLESLLRGL